MQGHSTSFKVIQGHSTSFNVIQGHYQRHSRLFWAFPIICQSCKMLFQGHISELRANPSSTSGC